MEGAAPQVQQLDHLLATQTAPDHTVLEIGTESGYQAAVLAELVREVYTIEIIPELASRASKIILSHNAILDRPDHERHVAG